MGVEDRWSEVYMAHGWRKEGEEGAREKRGGGTQGVELVSPSFARSFVL